MSKGDIITINDVIDRASKYLAEKDVTFIRRAYNFAKDAHANQFRKSGEPYIIHPVQVASILVDLQMDPETIAGGFLHDVIEDTEITFEEIETAFTREVAVLVDGVTKLGKIKYISKEALDRKSTRLNSSHVAISYAVFC